MTEAEILDAMRFVWERIKIVIEPSSAVAVAPLLNGKLDVRRTARRRHPERRQRRSRAVVPGAEGDAGLKPAGRGGIGQNPRSTVNSRHQVRWRSFVATHALSRSERRHWCISRDSPWRSSTSFVDFRSEAVIFSELGLILYSVHDLIPCMDYAPWTPRRPSVAGRAS